MTVLSDESLPEFGAVLVVGEHELARVSSPRGAPDRPATPAQLTDKVAGLAGDHLQRLLNDLDVSAATALEAAGLRGDAPRATRPA